MATLSEQERARWDVDPDEWPHTPPFHVFAALYDEDDNLWWRAGSGHGLNAYDAAREQIDDLTARLARVEALADLLAQCVADQSPLDLSKAQVIEWARHESAALASDPTHAQDGGAA